MPFFSKVKKQTPNSNTPEQVFLGEDFDVRYKWLKQSFDQCSDITIYELTANHTRCGIVYLQEMVDEKLFDEQVLSYIVNEDFASSHQEFIHKLLELKLISAMSSSILTDMQKAVELVLDGNILIFFEGDQRMLAFPLQKFEKRAISEPANENVIRGPREAFVEDIHTNITMIRRKIKSPALKMEQQLIGKFTKTKVVIGYLEGICKPEIIEEVRQRIGRIQMDGVLGSSYIEENIDDFPLSPFPQSQKTERPDVVAAALLEGRVVIFVDGTPIPLIVPVILTMFLQSPEDYYQRYVFANFVRWLRMAFIVISLLFPSFYIALTTFHPVMIPYDLLLSVAAARDLVPFPAMVEAFIMELTFEALREAGLRVPKAIGQAISILGALVIGQAAVQAGIVSAPMVIIVSLTGIASFIVPYFDFGFSIRLLRFPIMILSGSFGIFGLMIGCLLIYIHLVHLRSFGMPYLTPIAPIRANDLKDTFLRAPWWLMKRRPSFVGTKDHKRSNLNYPFVEEDED
ncbi:spore germination protein KA/spore germination protein [Neobacillus bataviensis]|uniref:Spore germination protein KA/spore germination protein n=1 Tax=Neobacillus bataviensis TaxID=220685 RepID=A0A561CEQ7_9BACI|nr:spore germination protein [Neobacillus bataviensis]TWD89723.1 spore germination protein KA/spore germination protein [Neobacillus bataviensis]